jgi:hypothetical protein
VYAGNHAIKKHNDYDLLCNKFNPSTAHEYQGVAAYAAPLLFVHDKITTQAAVRVQLNIN